MPSATHGSFIWQLGANICDNLRDLGRENEQVCDFTNSISNVLSPNLFLRDYDSTQGSTGKVEALRMSDTQFQHESATYPGVIVEVTLTQDAKRLARIAKDYIYLTEEAIQVVICINLNSDNDSTISVWKATYAPLPGTDQLELFYEEVVKREVCSNIFHTTSGRKLTEIALPNRRRQPRQSGRPHTLSLRLCARRVPSRHTQPLFLNPILQSG
jgi:hypothetical protein